MRPRSLTLIPLLALLGAATTGSTLARSGAIPADVQAVRAAVSVYHSYDEAQLAGFSIGVEPCVSSPAGTMGIHAANPARIASGVVDALYPPILIYLPRADGSLSLVAVEYFHVALANTANGPAPWFAATPPSLGFFNPAPSLFGHAFDGPMPGHNAQMPWHYDLHAWVIENNPAGTFAQWNTAISC